ncbi:hypothetical protein HKD37_10G028636 [Glycine soja]
MKEQMATMMKAMMSMKKIMEVNTVAVAATSIVAEVDLTPTFGLNQINHAISDMVGQRGRELGSTGGPHFVQVQNKHSFPQYGLALNHTPPNVAHTPNEDVDNSAPIPIKSPQPQADHAHVPQPMGETREISHRNLTDFEPRLGYATKGQAVGDMLPVSYYEKMVVYMPSSFADLVFAGERIEVGLRRGKFDCLALTSKKPGANRENEKGEGTCVLTAIPTWPNFLPAQQFHYSANENYKQLGLNPELGLDLKRADYLILPNLILSRFYLI